MNVIKLGPLIVDIPGYEISQEDREVLTHPLVGGVILFSKNFESKKQLVSLIKKIQTCRKGAELLITVDHEGGRVQRFKEGFTNLKALGEIGGIVEREGLTNSSISTATKRAYLHGATIGKELGEIGIDLSFTPCLDLNWRRSKVIGDRAISSDPELVGILCLALISGLNANGLKNCAKHFPGHGWAIEDSHNDFAKDDRALVEIFNRDLLPYKFLISELGVVSSVMASHVVYEKCNPFPASISRFWLIDILRNKLNFKGVVFCDDLSMQGVKIKSGILDLVDTAFVAGCDSLIICNDRENVNLVLDSMSINSIPVGLKNLETLKKR